MPLPIEVSYHRFDAPAEVRDKIAELIAHLDKYGDAITNGRVTVEAAHQHGDKTVLEIHVELNLRGRRVVGKRSAEFPSPAGQRSFVAAATEAFHVVQRQIKGHTEKISTYETKTLDHQRLRGRILDLDRDVESGFVEMADGASLFFSGKVLVNTAFNALAPGDTVMVTIADEESPYGPQASSVELEAPEERAR